jgi:hypothetical protein
MFAFGSLMHAIGLLMCAFGWLLVAQRFSAA